jgi:adenosylcobinamide-phosphate synthase
MRLEIQILAAFGLDLLLGDPRWFPHPVKLIGRFAMAMEKPLRKLIPGERVAGIAAVFLVVGFTGIVTYALISGSARIHPYAGNVVSIVFLYTTFASRDLMKHSYRVYRALRHKDLGEARGCVSMLVGRDTDQLNERDVSRAAVESVAENLVDGVTAPLFFAILGGPIVAMMYKAVSTLDSTFGYKDEKYLYFGWASARLDDVANYLPARLTAPLIAVTAAMLGFRPLNCLRIWLRDGALGVQLGGVNYYNGEPYEGSYFGDPLRSLEARDILSANRLMLGTAILFMLLFVGVRVAIV